MASLADIRQGIASTIESNISGLSAYPNVPESVNLPAVLVVPRSADLAMAFGRGLDTWQFDLILLVSRRDDGLAQDDLDPMATGAGISSIRQAIFTNSLIGLTDGTAAFVTGMSQYGATYDIGGVSHVGATLTCRVTTTGTA